MRNNNRHISKKFTNQAWEEMRKILNKEMPEEEKKRRLIPFWFKAGIGLAAGLAAFWLVSSLVLKEEPVRGGLVVEKNIEKDEGMEREQNKAFDSLKKEEESKIENESAAIAKSENPLIKKAVYEEKPHPEKKQIPLRNIDKELIVDKGPIEHSENKTKHSSLIHNKTNTINKLEPIAENTATNDKKEYVVNEIASPQLSILEPPDQEIPALDVEPYAIKNKGYSLFASVFSKPNTSSRGLALGILKTKKIGTKGNFRFSSGLAYAYVSQELVFVGSYEDTNGGLFDPGGLPANPVQSDDVLFNGISYSNAESSLTTDMLLNSESLPTVSAGKIDKLRMHYLQVPVQLSFQKSRLNFNVGLNASFLLASASNGIFDGGILKNDSNNRAGNNSGGFGQLFGKSSSLSYFDIQSSIGAGYNISRKIGLYLSYNMGMIDVIKTNNVKDYNRMFQFSLRYSL